MDLQKLSLVLALFGILLLLFLANVLNPKEIAIGEIGRDYINRQVQVKGTIKEIKDYDKFQILTIEDPSGKISAIANKPIKISKNQSVIITGTVQEYKENLQISADKIVLLR